jgi:hypothetical protein
MSKKRTSIAEREREAKKMKLAPGNAWVVGQIEVMQKQYQVSTKCMHRRRSWTRV